MWHGRVRYSQTLNEKSNFQPRFEVVRESPLLMTSCQCHGYSWTRTTIVFLLFDPTIWNSLGNALCDPDLNIASFGVFFKTKLFQHRAH